MAELLERIAMAFSGDVSKDNLAVQEYFKAIPIKLLDAKKFVSSNACCYDECYGCDWHCDNCYAY